MELILFSLALALLLIGSFTDFKWREIPDFISYSGIILGLSINLLHSIYLWDFSFVLQSLIGFGFFLVLGCLLYYTSQWGGGDAKALMAFGALVGAWFSLNNAFVSFFVNLLFVTAIYCILWLSFVALRNWSKVRTKLYDLLGLNEYKSFQLIMLFVFIVVLFLLYFIDYPLNFICIFIWTSIFFVYYLTFFMLAVESTCMQKLADVNDLTEGDWILQDIFVGDKRIVKRKEVGGIRKEQIDELLKSNKHHKLNKVLIRVGIPLVPSFCIAWIFTLIYGSFLSFL